jgi:hypothetical protein
MAGFIGSTAKKVIAPAETRFCALTIAGKRVPEGTIVIGRGVRIDGDQVVVTAFVFDGISVGARVVIVVFTIDCIRVGLDSPLAEMLQDDSPRNKQNTKTINRHRRNTQILFMEHPYHALVYSIEKNNYRFFLRSPLKGVLPLY